MHLEGIYFKHYEGMSWRVQRYNPNFEDTDVDIGGTHPNKLLYDLGNRVKRNYISDTLKYDKANLKGRIA